MLRYLLVVFYLATSSASQSCGVSPKVHGVALEDLIKNTKRPLLVAIPHMRCTQAVENALKQNGLNFKTVSFAGNFQFVQGQNSIWDWLDCTYPDDKNGGTTMHSYLFYGGEFIGDGFAAATKVSQDPSKFKSHETTLLDTNTEHEWAEEPELSLVQGADCSSVASTKTFLNQYNNIFKTGNRNAASHLWSSFLLQRSTCMTQSDFEALNKQFCAVSGSPLGNPDTSQSCYVSSHPMVSDKSNLVTGQEHHCCAPCYCDAKDWTAIDTLTVSLKSGTKKQFHFFVIGDPCEKGGIPETLHKSAPELVCDGSSLRGATKSDHGHVIIGMFLVGAGQGSACVYGEDKHQQLDSMCTQRAASGDKSGMGKIFIDLARVNPVTGTQ